MMFENYQTFRLHKLKAKCAQKSQIVIVLTRIEFITYDNRQFCSADPIFRSHS